MEDVDANKQIIEPFLFWFICVFRNHTPGSASQYKLAVLASEQNNDHIFKRQKSIYIYI